MYQRLGLFYLFVFLSLQATAQEFLYQNFNELNGLPSSETYEVFQDSKGFIWVATDRGVSRYDGGVFQNFSIRDGLSDNTVFGFYEDSTSRIWFRTYSGALSYFQNDSIHHYKYNAALTRELGRAILSKIFIDGDDNLWFSSILPGRAGRIDKQGQLSMLDKGDDNYLFLYPVDQEYLVGYTPHTPRVETIKIADKKFPVEVTEMLTGNARYCYAHWYDRLLVSVNRDIFQLHQGILTKVFTSEAGILGLTVDRDNHLWVSFFDGGVKRFSNNQFSNAFEIPFLRNESIGNVFKDNEGGHWVCTLDHGVYYLPNIDIELLPWTENSKVAFAASDGQRLYVGNYLGELTALDAASKTVIWSKDLKVSINSIFVDKTGNVWVGNILNLSCFRPNGDKLFSLDMIQGAKAYHEKEDGTVWIGNNNGVFEVSPQGSVTSHGILQKRIFSLFVTDSIVYVGAINGLSTYKPDFIESENQLNIKSRISVLHQFSPGTLLVGTVGEGLIVLSKGKIKHVNQFAALGDVIYSILLKDRYLWISTENGVARIPTDTFLEDDAFKINFLTRSSGLISDKNNILVSAQNYIWSFSDLGISIIPDDIKTFQYENPVSYLESIEVNDVPVHPSSWRFAPSQNNISLEIGIISFNNRKLFYRHRLNPHDAWNQSHNRTVSYYSLQPSDYDFEMQVSTDNRHWSAVPLKLQFEILTPWWKRWYAMSLYACMVVGVGITAYRVRINAWKRKQAYLEVINNHQQELIKSEVEALERDRRRIAKDLHDGVGTALTSIKWMVNDAIRHKPANQEQTSKKINDNFNEIILEIKRIIYDLNPPALERYGLEVGLKNFIDRVNERTDVKAQLDYFGTGEVASKISTTVYRIVQELVNNTLKHSKATEIKIHVNQFEDIINLMYEDNGIGMREVQYNGLGIHNIESRVQTLKGRMSLESNEKGTFYNFDIPFKTTA